MKKEYVATPSTLCGAERFIYSDGKARGVEAVRMYNGKIDLTVILDRGMDIFKLFYKGTPISYISKNGLVSPKLCETAAYTFLNSFDAGFVYTCGLDNVGAPYDKNGAHFVQHGSNSYIPAENVCVLTEEKDGEYYITLKGELHVTALFGKNLVMCREISMKYLGDEVTITDSIRNDGFTDGEYMIMYHSNIGYPILNEKATLKVDSNEIRPISDSPRMDKYSEFTAPSPESPEEVMLHVLNKGRGVKARLDGEALALELIFDTDEFPYLVEWKSMASGDYVLGIEPSTIPMPERTPRILKPSESAHHSVTWRFEEK